jgi:hypothetical protein
MLRHSRTQSVSPAFLSGVRRRARMGAVARLGSMLALLAATLAGVPILMLFLVSSMPSFDPSLVLYVAGWLCQ